MARRRRRNPVSAQNWLFLGGVAAVVYLVYRFLVKPASQAATVVATVVSQGYNSAVDAVSSGLYSLFGPEENFGANTYYTVVFPDTTTHAVPSNIVGADGQFDWTGYPAGSQPSTRLQIIVDGSGHKFAIPP